MNPIFLSLILLDTPLPPLTLPVLPSDLERFPGSCACSAAEDFNTSVQEGVSQRIGIQNKEAFLLACRDRYQAWLELDLARAYRWDEADCLRHLKNLRELIGLDAYERGVMPCAVPMELMQSAN